MADGVNAPLTREDVLKAIEQNGTAEGLDLSGKIFEEGVDLRGVTLNGIILKGARLPSAHLEGAHLENARLEGASLREAHLEGADLWKINLEKAYLFNVHLEGADLLGARLEGANLASAFLEGANLGYAHLEGSNLAGARFDAQTKMENIDWGSYVLADETLGSFAVAAETYRRLKLWYTSAGRYDSAGEFFFRELTAQRKALPWKPNPLKRVWSKSLSLLCGYGEKWERVIMSAAVVIFCFALIYYIIGTLTPNTFLDCLYYSAVSFIPYGSWAAEPAGWVKALGVVEAFIGVFMMALFLVVFTRKMGR